MYPTKHILMYELKRPYIRSTAETGFWICVLGRHEGMRTAVAEGCGTERLGLVV